MVINFNPSAIAQIANRPDFFEKGHEQLEQAIFRFQQQNPQPSLTIETEPEQQQLQQFIFAEEGFRLWMPRVTLTQATNKFRNRH